MKKSILLAVVLATALSIGPVIAGAPQKGGHKGVPVNQSNRDMRQGIRLAHQAHQVLESALPVYKGNRVDALKEIRAGVMELTEALKGTKDTTAPKGKGQAKGGGKSKAEDNDSKSKYSAAQIADSDKKVSQASALLDQAIKKLDNADPMYHGERMDAIAKFKEAQKHLGTALTIK